MSSVTVSSVTYSTRERVYRVATAAGKAPSTQAISTMVRRYSLQTHNWSTGPRETRLERSQGVRGSWGKARLLRDPDSVFRVPIRCFIEEPHPRSKEG